MDQVTAFYRLKPVESQVSAFHTLDIMLAMFSIPDTFAALFAKLQHCIPEKSLCSRYQHSERCNSGYSVPDTVIHCGPGYSIADTGIYFRPCYSIPNMKLWAGFTAFQAREYIVVQVTAFQAQKSSWGRDMQIYCGRD